MTSSATKKEITPIFARHETFHPRYGWLKKGFDKASEDDNVFLKEDAPVVLGVGKNMVKAIKYWSIAFKILEETKLPGNKGNVHHPSDFGSKLLGRNGWDPFLEDLASLWLLHWNLLKKPVFATAWHFAFNVFNKHTFTTDDLLASLLEYNDRHFSEKNISESSFAKDTNCILRMYVEYTDQKVLKEDSIDCPFTELGIIKNHGDKKHFTFNVGPKPGLSAEIIVASCLEFISSIESGANSISISRLLYDQGSPGLSFKITETLLCESIAQVAKKFKDLSLSESAGLTQFSFPKEPLKLAEKILNYYYGQRSN